MTCRHPSRRTLPEVLLSASVVAVLSLILVPVLSVRRVHSRDERFVENLKRSALATLIYTNDYDDLMPFAFARRPGGTWRWNAYTGIPAGWRANPPVNEETAWPNSVAPYFRDWSIFALPGEPQFKPYQDSDYQNARFRWANSSVSINGLLTQYSVIAVTEPNKLPMIWTGYGRVQLAGASLANPTLACTDLSIPCVYTPSSQALTGAWLWPSQATAWVEHRSMYFVSVEGTFELVPAAGIVGAVDNQDVGADPFAQYDSNGQPVSMWVDNFGKPFLFRPDYDFSR